jgi:hypothetical protein
VLHTHTLAKARGVVSTLSCLCLKCMYWLCLFASEKVGRLDDLRIECVQKVEEGAD